MRQSQRPFGEEGTLAESRRLTPSIGIAPDPGTDSAPPSDAANEDFLFHLYRGSELLQDNRVHEAKEELERALHLQPRDAKGQDLLAVVYFRLGLYPRAISIYERLRRKNPNDPALLLNLALCFLKTGQPNFARRDLEQLLAVNPSHSRAWGYLGLACERLGDLAHAQKAFEQGGHAQMARRISLRRESVNATPVEPEKPASEPTREVREVVAAAYQELDAGELSFALAEPTLDTKSNDANAQSWRPVELGQEGAARKEEPRPAAGKTGTEKPETRDGPPPPPSAPPPAAGGERRPTLIAPIGAPPAHEVIAEYSVVGKKIPSQKQPAFTLDDAGTPSLRRPVVAVPPVAGAAKRTTTLEMDAQGQRRRTLPPPHGRPTSPKAPHPARTGTTVASAAEPPTPHAASTAEIVEEDVVAFPEKSGAAIHASGMALVRTTAEVGFSARLEALRAQSNNLTMKLLERHVKGKPTGESFGGVGSPVVHATGDGQLMLAPRAGRRLSSFMLEDETCFAREDVLLGWGGSLTFENGRLATGEGESVAVVQLRGTGAVLFEAIGDILTLEVAQGRGMSVRREAILGWFGRLVPRALAPSEAPCGQRGLVTFAGEGRVLVTSA